MPTVIDLPTPPRESPAPPAAPPAGGDPVTPIARRVESRVRSVLARHRDTWAAEQPALSQLFAALDGFVAAGGKRLRPAFCYWGALAGGATGDEPELLDTCAALELLHAFALIHDDVMDGSATRRGQPALHARFATRHATAGGAGESRRHGEGLAILAGDLAFVLADTLVDAAPASVRCLWHEMRVELVAGQWVDVVAAASSARSPTWPAGWPATSRAGTPWSGRSTSVRPWPAKTGSSARTPHSASRWARPSSCVTTSWACTATPSTRASRQVTTCARANPRCSSPWPPAMSKGPAGG